MTKPKREGVYAEGYRAFARSNMEECPHRYLSDAYHTWRMAWWAAKTDYDKDQGFTGEP